MTARGGHSDAQKASLVTRDVAELLLHRAPLGLETAGVGEELLACIGERQRRVTVDQAGAQFALEVGDVGGKCLLCDGEALGRAREAALLRHGDEVIKAAEVQAGLLAGHLPTA